jgi:NADPH:quinone reductase-like Zn-dependent oxidoreductase
MRALVVNDGKLEIADVAEPVAASDQAIVNVRAFSLNRGEVRGVRNAATGARPGWDVAGTLDSGERVVGIVRNGGWAERVAVRKRDLAVLPDAVSLEDAAALPVAELQRACSSPGRRAGWEGSPSSSRAAAVRMSPASSAGRSAAKGCASSARTRS